MNSSSMSARQPDEGPPNGGAMTAMEYERQVQVVSRNILTLNTNATKLDELLPKLGTAQDTPGFRNTLQQLQQRSLQVIRATKTSFEDLEQRQPALTKSEQVQCTVRKRRMMGDFTAAVDKVKVAQSAILKKEQDCAGRARAASSPKTMDIYGDNSWEMAPTHTLDLASGHQQPISMTLPNPELELMAERERDIHKLETDIVAINDIMTDLASLVHEQGDTVRSIEDHVESALDHVEDGREQLQKAVISKNKNRRRKVIVLLLLLVLVAVVATIIGVTVHQQNK